MNASLTPDETTVQKVKLLINGEWVESQTTEWHDIVNPATQQVLAKVPFATASEVDAAIAAAHRAFQRTDAPRHRGVIHGQAFGGRAGLAGTGHLEEKLQVIPVQGAQLCDVFLHVGPAFMCVLIRSLHIYTPKTVRPPRRGPRLISRRLVRLGSQHNYKSRRPA